MRELKKMATIIKNAPAITDEDVEVINRSFEPYIFYKNDKKDRAQHCICSRCREHFTVSELQRTMTPEDREFLSATHNKFVKCPKCGVTAQKKQIGVVKSCSTLGGYSRTVLVKRRSENEVYLIYTYNTKDYLGFPHYEAEKGLIQNVEYDTLPRYEVNAIYYLTPNQQRMFKKNWYSDMWDETKIKEPFNKSLVYNFSRNTDYWLVGTEKLENTFLKYLDISKYAKLWGRCTRGYSEIPYCKIISLFAKYKSLEFLAKQGFDDFVFQMINKESEAPTLYDWQATTPYKFFKKLSKSEIKELKGNDVCTRGDVYCYLQMKAVNKNISVEEYVELKKAGGYYFEALSKKMRKYKIQTKTMLNFLNKLENGKKVEDFERLKAYRVSMWFDYVKAAEACGYDLSVHNVLFPKDLKTAHDEAVAVREQIRFENEKKSQAEKLKKEQDALNDKNNSYAKRYKKLQKAYEYCDEKYCIVIPKGATEIVLEGRALSHCVGGYAERHIKGKTTILFMRNVENTEEALVTIELNEESLTVIQAHGKKNRDPSDEEQAFIDKWLKNVKRRKNKKTSKKKVA